MKYALILQRIIFPNKNKNMLEDLYVTQEQSKHKSSRLLKLNEVSNSGRVHYEII